jgi:hypothetical protein
MSLPTTTGAARDVAATRFPNEIIENIVLQVVDPATLGAMMRVSRGILAMAAPRLYCEIRVSSENAYSLYLGLKTSDEEIESSDRAVKAVEGSITRPCLQPGGYAIEGEVIPTGQSHSSQSTYKLTKQTGRKTRVPIILNTELSPL